LEVARSENDPSHIKYLLLELMTPLLIYAFQRSISRALRRICLQTQPNDHSGLEDLPKQGYSAGPLTETEKTRGSLQLQLLSVGVSPV
jgi:hypothetical protein